VDANVEPIQTRKTTLNQLKTLSRETSLVRDLNPVVLTPTPD